MTVTESDVLSASQVSLSTAMREGSMAEHEAAENAPFVSQLLAGHVNERGYADYLLRLRVVYAALEDVVRRHAGDPLVDAVRDPALERLASIDADLDHWAPGTDRAVDSPAAETYRERLLGASWGGAVLAHHYTRYLGDLSGGQAIGTLLGRTFGLEDGDGLAFYAFPEIPKTKPYKDAYRARLDGLGLGTLDTERVVAEVKVAFRLNQALFVELSERLPSYAR